MNLCSTNQSAPPVAAEVRRRIYSSATGSASSPRRLLTRAVTILELLVAVSLISIIILVLYQMFDRTQAQMRKAVRDVDKFESGRAAADILQRDLSQMVAAHSIEGGAGANFYTSTNWSGGAFDMLDRSNSVVQANVLQDVFFLTFDAAATPTNWTGVGYRVASSTNANVLAEAGLGTLYRWTTNANRFSTNLQSTFLLSTLAFPPVATFQRVVDNVVHFRVTAITNSVAVPITNVNIPFPATAAILTSNDLPSHIQVELGYVDSRTAGRALGIVSGTGNTNLMRSYLSTNLDAVHVFRLNVPVRTGLQ
ncbi:MAG: hypothetical protein RL514_241 [Verrucomicrobiota bacterium]|jgi:Tfp pilus assembly protein PilV